MARHTQEQVAINSADEATGHGAALIRPSVAYAVSNGGPRCWVLQTHSPTLRLAMF